MEKYMNIVIVGHVDHGKSTLIGRLLYDTKSVPESIMDEIKKVCEELGRNVEFAYLLDSLEEEREQSVTIDTTQIFFKTPMREYTIIDAPGHKEFLKNMITGASLAEAAILIVDAKEGVQEQTKRHAYILSMLGLKQVIVVINKMDLVGYDEKVFIRVKDDVLGFLEKIGINPGYVIPISSMKGDNVATKSGSMPWYNGITILDALDTFKTGPGMSEKPMRFPVQDVYKTEDKRILVGRVEAGRLKEGDEITFLPSGKKTRIKSVEIWNQQRKEAEAGESIGITLEEPLFIERGEVACSGTLPEASDRIRASLFWMSNAPISLNEKVILKCTTQEVPCFIESIDKKMNSSTLEIIEKAGSELNETEIGNVIIKTEKQVITENFNDIEALGRFVIVRNENTAAGGITIA